MPTRTIFFDAPLLSEAIFYLAALASLAVCFYGVYRRVAIWRAGAPEERILDQAARIRSMLQQVLAQRRVRRKRYAGSLHVMIFFGMLALFTGTVIVGIEHYGAYLFGNHWLYRGWFYLACKVTLDLFGLAVLVGTVMALARRHAPHSPHLGQSWKDDAFLALLIAATITGFVLEGAGIAADPRRAPYAAFSPIGSQFAHLMHGITPGYYLLAWWIHAVLVLTVIAVLPYGRWLHLFIIPATIARQPERKMGVLPPIDIEKVEQTGVVGLATTAELDRWQRMSLDGCMECGRCTDACPANAVGKPLNPKQIVLDLRALLASPPPAGDSATSSPAASTDVISDESLWACTNCHACVRECPALIRHVDIIDGIRRYRVAEGRLAGTAATMLRQLSSRENPWGLPASQRLDWARGMELTPASADDGREVLLWVGCAGAFEPRAQATVRALAEVLTRAGIKFSVLGTRERCTGDPARRTGDEFLYQQLAETNIATLNEIKAKTIVTHCPHCFHTMKNEYPQFGGEYEVLHHTEFLARLQAQGTIKTSATNGKITYHDPCFLARVNGVTQPPRDLITGATGATPLEPGRKESRTFCCGAGGGRMWMEEPPGQRPGVNRAKELIATGAETVAVGCPFCKVMVGDSLLQVAGDSAPRIADVAEVVLEAMRAGENQA